MEDQKRASSNHSVFVDTDIFVALARADDANHDRALDLLQKLAALPVTFLTSNYVFTESVTVISQRVSHHAALTYIKELKSPDSAFTMYWIDEVLEELALQLFAKQASKNTSLVDCTNMAVLSHERINYIFSFDAVYTQNGYHMVEELATP